MFSRAIAAPILESAALFTLSAALYACEPPPAPPVIVAGRAPASASLLPAAPAEAASTPSAAAPAKPAPPITAEDAVRVVRALAGMQDIATALGLKTAPEVWIGAPLEPACETSAVPCEWTVHVGLRDDTGELTAIYQMYVDATSGEVSVDERFMQSSKGDPPRSPYPQWLDSFRNRRRVIAVLEALPEVKAFWASLRKRGTARVMYAEERPEQGCAAGAPGCRWQFRIGEAGDPVAWNQFQVDSRTFAVWVWDWPSSSFVPYQAWKRTRH